jgi:hypothetical protein
MSVRVPFFVVHLGESHYRPDPRAKFSIQELDEEGRATVLYFFDEGGNQIGLKAFAGPRAVVEAALRQEYGQGDYVDESGRSVRPF